MVETEANRRLESLPRSDAPNMSVWESAYLSFETPEEEIRKFVRRLVRMGVEKWRRDARTVELFCGRGNGLHALERLGFKNIEGVDLSPRLLKKYQGIGRLYLCDCRYLPFADQSRDVLIIQGGLHHLNNIADDVDQAFREIRRVLRKDGNIVIVEPWLTPFLRLIHTLSENRMVRRCSKKFDSFAIMTENERETYEAWLSNPQLIRNLSRAYFRPVYESFRWGKWSFVGKPL